MSKKNRKNWGLEAKPEQVEVEAQEASAEAQSEPALEFDAWWAMRSGMIPAHHHKEVIKADMRARGLGNLESMHAFDEALAKYGIKLS